MKYKVFYRGDALSRQTRSMKHYLKQPAMITRSNMKNGKMSKRRNGEAANET